MTVPRPEAAYYIVEGAGPCPHCGNERAEIKMVAPPDDEWRVGQSRRVICPDCESTIIVLTRRAED